MHPPSHVQQKLRWFATVSYRARRTRQQSPQSPDSRARPDPQSERASARALADAAAGGCIDRTPRMTCICGRRGVGAKIADNLSDDLAKCKHATRCARHGLGWGGGDPCRYSLHVRPGPRLDMPAGGTARRRDTETFGCGTYARGCARSSVW
jgi:hypothetical protein